MKHGKIDAINGVWWSMHYRECSERGGIGCVPKKYTLSFLFEWNVLCEMKRERKELHKRYCNNTENEFNARFRMALCHCLSFLTWFGTQSSEITGTDMISRDVRWSSLLSISPIFSAHLPGMYCSPHWRHWLKGIPLKITKVPSLFVILTIPFVWTTSPPHSKHLIFLPSLFLDWPILLDQVRIL